MPEIIEHTDLTQPGEDGWHTRYKVRRDDGGEITVEAAASRTAETVARGNDNPDGMAFADDRGRQAALEYAEKAQSPAQRGETIVRLTLDYLSGGVTHEYDYRG